MDDPQRDVGSTAATDTPVEGWMLREDIVREVLARLARGECVKAIARELGVDKKTIKRWRARGEWRPRTTAGRAKAIDAYRLFLARRGPEVGWKGMVLHRELRTRASRAAISRSSGRCSRCGRRAGGRRARPCGSRRPRVSRRRSISGSYGCGLPTWRPRSISSSSHSASPGGPWPMPTATSGSTRCSMATSGRCGTLAGCRSAVFTTIRGRSRWGDRRARYSGIRASRTSRGTTASRRASAVKHEMDALVGRDRSQTARQMLTAPGERRIVGGGEVEAQSPQIRTPGSGPACLGYRRVVRS